MFCPKCGNQLTQNANFCNKCGTPLNLINNNQNQQTMFNPNIVNTANNNGVENSNTFQNNNQINENIVQENIQMENNNSFQSNNQFGNNYQNNNMNTMSNNQQYSNMVTTPNNGQFNNYQSNNYTNFNSQNNYNQNQTYNMNNYNGNNYGYYSQPPKKGKSAIGICAAIFLIFIIVAVVIGLDSSSDEFYFNDDYSDKPDTVVKNDSNKKNTGKYQTVINPENTYTGANINSISDANALIVKDSVDQKSQCPSAIKSIEDDIINNYGITAVNLCEMDLGFARELANVVKKVYNEYPTIRGSLTNLTLINAPVSQGYIAAFGPIFIFAQSNTSSTFPWVNKSQIILNTTYYLNKERFKTSIDASVKAGHFPKNATIYSPLAHELGHYISFIAMLKYYNMDSILLVNAANEKTVVKILNDFKRGDYSLSMIREAYNNYKRDTGSNIGFDEWRGTISKYALAKDEKGQYIYDETIAESFHDVYLNGDNAVPASKYVIAVLKQKVR